MNKNTVLFIEPRPIDYCVPILNQYIRVLGNSWNYVFYCGKENVDNLKQLGIADCVELRELDVYNFDHHSEYSDFLKQKSLWESLTGEYVLTAQVDTWVFEDGINIDFFINLDKSYIGGNMECRWIELERDGFLPTIKCFNGGLSLRKRQDMLRVIDDFPPVYSARSNELSTKMETDAEDVYFTIGCYRLGLPVGDDNISRYFSLHHTFVEPFFGTHQPSINVRKKLIELYPKLGEENPYLQLL